MSKLPRIHWGYLLLTIIISAALYVGSLILFPQWKNLNGWVIILLVTVFSVAVQFVANFRTIIEPSNLHSNEPEKRKLFQWSKDKMKDENCESLERQLALAKEVLQRLQEQSNYFSPAALPVEIKMNLDHQNQKVGELEKKLEKCKEGKDG